MVSPVCKASWWLSVARQVVGPRGWNPREIVRQRREQGRQDETPSDAGPVHSTLGCPQIVSGLIPARLVSGGSITRPVATQSTRGETDYSVNQRFWVRHSQRGSAVICFFSPMFFQAEFLILCCWSSQANLRIK